jgi:Zn-dependent protease
MRNLFQIMTIRGVPVRLHYTWLIAVLIGIPFLTTITIPMSMPDSSTPTRVLLALLILAIFFGAVVVHELAHLLVARLLHVRFPVINLYPLGAITRLPERYGKPNTAFWIAAAGPIASIALSWVLITLASASGISLWLAAALAIGGWISLYLGLINLLPGLPLDAGHMLRAVLEFGSGSAETATRIARVAGRVIAYGLVSIGAIRMIGAQDWLLGGALLLVGWAIRDAGGTAYRRRLVVQLLNRLTAADVLSKPEQTIGPERSLRDFATMLRGRMGDKPTPVIANDSFIGVINRNLLRAVPQGHWDERTVAEDMIPAANLMVVPLTTPVSMLIPHLASDAVVQQPYVAVVHEGQLCGMIDADELLVFLDLEDEFGLFARGPIAWQPVVAAPASRAGQGDAVTGEYTAREHAVGQ